MILTLRKAKYPSWLLKSIIHYGGYELEPHTHTHIQTDRQAHEHESAHRHRHGPLGTHDEYISLPFCWPMVVSVCLAELARLLGPGGRGRRVLWDFFFFCDSIGHNLKAIIASQIIFSALFLPPTRFRPGPGPGCCPILPAPAN